MCVKGEGIVFGKKEDDHVRQLTISGMHGESVNLLSSFKHEDLKFLGKLALELLKDIKELDKK